MRAFRGALGVGALAALAVAQTPHGRTQARSMVISKLGIVAASQTLAAQAGAQILAEGGSAADAAIAANATLGVVEPMMNGMGGDLFAQVWEAKTGKLAGCSIYGRAKLKGVHEAFATLIFSFPAISSGRFATLIL